MQNPDSLVATLRAFRQCGFSLVIPELDSCSELVTWALKASAFAYGYTWDDDGDDDISVLIRTARQAETLQFDMDGRDLSDEAQAVWAYAQQLLPLAVGMTNEQVKVGKLNRSAI